MRPAFESGRKIGVDNSKAKLDVYRPDTKAFIHRTNTEEDTQEFSKSLKRKRQRTRRRNQLLGLINQENNRLKQTWGEDAKESIRVVLECLKKQLKQIDSQLAKMLKVDQENNRIIEILGSIKCVGPVLISTRITSLPELGKPNRKQIAKRVRVAPIHRDSGSKSGKRFIGRGRGKVRRVLYIAAVVGIRPGAVRKAYDTHLNSKGKESKVAMP
ncbi:Transposase IS116/IS110/IS902 family protein [Novipirellula aureliae]|uniref:Transposase IS116/IS110/IS902 family protein n=1 Tax=Novipirellula aureliae TaxID=2527966 RepID=A0A5C6E866_9BACT|nr:transposase [Novipirellula aureliae]TWU45030.1 Transposase IS116/IS110/IS902 family protein [Novipirellula aureliae]